jgi:hypothetical protein
MYIRHHLELAPFELGLNTIGKVGPNLNEGNQWVKSLETLENKKIGFCYK